MITMSLEQTACDDLKAFERRLTEVISCLQPATMRWRILLVVVSVCTAIAAWHWLSDPLTAVVSLTQSLWNHPFFAFTSTFLVTAHLLVLQILVKRGYIILWILLYVYLATGCPARDYSCDATYVKLLPQPPENRQMLLFMMGVHRKVIAPSIITARTRSVLNDFNMSCDDTGKLILKPRPANT